MNYKVIFRIIFILISILFLCSSDSFAGPVLRQEILSNDIFDKVFHYHNTYQMAKARDELRKIADENRGTDIGGTALLWMVDFTNREIAVQIYEEIIRDYPETRYWLVAKYGIASKNYSFVKKVEEANKTIKQINGLDLYKFLEGDFSDYSSKNVPEKYRKDLANIYCMINGSYDNPGDIRSEYKYNPETSLRQLIFIRTAFPEFDWDNIIGEIRLKVREMNGMQYVKDSPDDNSPPTVWPIHPHPGSSAGRRRPWIKFKAYDGDLSQSQIDLPKMVFTLDGQDLTKDMTVQSIIDKSGHFSMKNPTKKAFELLIIKYRPPYPLTDGRHTVYIKVPDRRGHVTEKIWNFDVKPGTSHPDDNLPDEHTQDEDN